MKDKVNPLDPTSPSKSSTTSSSSGAIAIPSGASQPRKKTALELEFESIDAFRADFAQCRVTHDEAADIITSLKAVLKVI